MRRVINPLTEMGANIESTNDGFAPLTIHGSKLHSIEYTMPMASAQVKSSILLASLLLMELQLLMNLSLQEIILK